MIITFFIKNILLCTYVNVIFFTQKNITTHHFKRKIIKYLINIIVHIKIKYT